VSALGSMQALEQLNQVIRTEKDPDVRRSAVRALGRLQTEKTGAMLVDMYGSEQDLDTRRSVISALTAQHNAEALVAIARKETSLELKRDIVKRLSDLAPKSKVAADFLMELINK
jgi:HEAT repeat protein